MANNTGEFTALVGIDRSDRHLDLCWQLIGEEPVRHITLPNTPERVQAWFYELRLQCGGKQECGGEQVGNEPRIAVCFEQPAPALVNLLTGIPGLTVYPLNPLTLARYREAFNTSRAKNDAGDATCLLELVRDQRHKLTPWQADDQITRALNALVEARRKAIDWRTQVTNRLTAHLKVYYPQALELAGDDLATTLACDFLERWPSLDELQRARKNTLRNFYLSHHCRRPEVIERRLGAIAEAVPVTRDQAILLSGVLTTRLLVAQLRDLESSIRTFDAEIEKVLTVHQDAFIFTSLPGAGAVTAARLLAACGSDRDRFASAQAMQNYTGIAPIVKQSGKTRLVQRRLAKPRFVHQSWLEYAGQSIQYSAWAKAFYRQQRGRGNGHFTALRALAFKWIRIVFRCWKERVAYDESRYLQSLRRAGAPLCALLSAAL